MSYIIFEGWCSLNLLNLLNSAWLLENTISSCHVTLERESERDKERECVFFKTNLKTVAFSSILDVILLPSSPPLLPFLLLRSSKASLHFILHIAPLCLLLSSFLELRCPKYPMFWLLQICQVMYSNLRIWRSITNENMWHLFSCVCVSSLVFNFQLTST